MEKIVKLYDANIVALLEDILSGKKIIDESIGIHFKEIIQGEMDRQLENYLQMQIGIFQLNKKSMFFPVQTEVNGKLATYLVSDSSLAKSLENGYNTVPTYSGTEINRVNIPTVTAVKFLLVEVLDSKTSEFLRTQVRNSYAAATEAIYRENIETGMAKLFQTDAKVPAPATRRSVMPLPNGPTGRYANKKLNGGIRLKHFESRIESDNN